VVYVYMYICIRYYNPPFRNELSVIVLYVGHLQISEFFSRVRTGRSLLQTERHETLRNTASGKASPVSLSLTDLALIR
jgi:hypothetical protein